LYSSVMLGTPVPTSSRGWSVNGCEFESDWVGCFSVEFSQVRTDLPSVLLCDGRGSYRGMGVYFSPELSKLREVDPAARIEIIDGFVFLDTAVVFADYVRRLYALRLQDPGGPLSLLCKYLLNSLYGKFGQHPIREQIVSVDSFERLYELIEDGARVKVIDDDRGIYSMEQETVCRFEHVGIAGIVTSAARAKLYDGLIQAGFSNVLYCDTDSVHTLMPLSGNLVGAALGAFKLEFVGEAVYAGKKLYALRNGSGETIRAKGVSVGGRNGCRLSFDDIRSLAEDPQRSIQCRFSRPATPRQVFHGQAPCYFTEKTRSIRMTKNG